MTKRKNYQSFEPCTACGTESVQRCYHHIFTRKARPDLAEESWNKMSLCMKCHTEVHQIGMGKFIKYERVYKWLTDNNHPILRKVKSPFD